MRRWIQTDCLWVITDDTGLEERVNSALKGQVCLRTILKGKLDEPSFWRCTLTLPAIVLLHLGDDLDWGAKVLRDIKGAHLRIPIVVLSKEFNSEFGSKIISEGASYFMLWDFDPNELNEVVHSLLNHSHQAGR